MDLFKDFFVFELVCQTRWNVSVGRARNGGIPFPSATSQSQCRAVCMANTTCVGIDIDPRPNKTYCWLHYNDNDEERDDLELQYQAIIRCPDPGKQLFTLCVFTPFVMLSKSY